MYIKTVNVYERIVENTRRACVVIVSIVNRDFAAGRCEKPDRRFVFRSAGATRRVFAVTFVVFTITADPFAVEIARPVGGGGWRKSCRGRLVGVKKTLYVLFVLYPSARATTDRTAEYKKKKIKKTIEIYIHNNIIYSGSRKHRPDGARGRGTAAASSRPFDPRRRVSRRHIRVLRRRVVPPPLLFRRRAAGSGRFIFARQTSSLPPRDGRRRERIILSLSLSSPTRTSRPRGRSLAVSLSTRDFVLGPLLPVRRRRR